MTDKPPSGLQSWVDLEPSLEGIGPGTWGHFHAGSLVSAVRSGPGAGGRDRTGPSKWIEVAGGAVGSTQRQSTAGTGEGWGAHSWGKAGLAGGQGGRIGGYYGLAGERRLPKARAALRTLQSALLCTKAGSGVLRRVLP